jgi:DHA1 family tetracycline resistance protein-like MFS transporter
MPDWNNQTAWRRWIEPWYISYALLGLVVAGLTPILLPIIADRQDGVGHVGLVMAFFQFGGLTAPLWGRLADRFRLHRWLLAGGLVITSASLLVFAEIDSSNLRLVFALLLGIGSKGAATVANLFIVEIHPKEEWDSRVSWLQTFYGGGQVGGLLLAGVVTNFHPSYGLIIAAILTGVAILPVWTSTRTPQAGVEDKPILSHLVREGEWSWGSHLHHFHMPSFEDFRHLKSILASPFLLFLVVWSLAFVGSFSVFSIYPLLMQAAYGITPEYSSLIYAVAVAIRLRLYTLTGRWADRIGPSRVLLVGFLVRLSTFTALFILTLTSFAGQKWLATLSFSLLVLSWALVIVSATVLTASLSPVGEGAGMGFFNAASALSGVLGAATGGWIAERWGYSSTLIMAISGLSLSIIMVFAIDFLDRGRSRNPRLNRTD